MNATQVSVVLYGRHAHLLELRKWFLHSIGYRVFTAMQLSDLDVIPIDAPIALVAFCHTVSDSESQVIVAKATLRWPDIKALSLARDGSERCSSVPAVTAHLADAPIHLSNMISQLVGHPISSSHSHTY